MCVALIPLTPMLRGAESPPHVRGARSPRGDPCIWKSLLDLDNLAAEVAGSDDSQGIVCRLTPHVTPTTTGVR